MKERSQPLVSIVTVNYNTVEHTRNLIESIKKSAYSNYEIVVVDNASTEQGIESVLDLGERIILVKSPKNLGFSGGNNLGFDHTTGEFILMLNSDTLIEKETIQVLIDELEEDSSVGIVSPKIKYYHSDNLIQYAGSTDIHPLTLRNRHLGNKEIDDGRFDQKSETPFAHGAAMMFRRSLLKEAGPLPEVYFLYYEELDWSTKVKSLGYKIMYQPDSTVHHKESASIGKESAIKVYYLNRNRVLYARRNLGTIPFMMALLYLMFISVPRNTLRFLQDAKKLQAYYCALGWNLTNGKITYKPV